MRDPQKNKAPRSGSSEKSPTKFMERPGAKPHPESELTKDRYEEGSNAEVAGLYADAAKTRDADTQKMLPKKGPRKADDAEDEDQPGFTTPESDQK